MSKTVYTFEQMVEAAEIAPTLSTVNIYQGHVEPGEGKAVKVATWRPMDNDGERSFGRAAEVFSRSTFGNFTALLKPGNEILYFTNGRPTSASISETAMPNEITGVDINELINKAVERERRIQELESECDELRAELDELNATEGKFHRTLINALEFFANRNNRPAPAPQPMQGVNTNTMDELENALAVLVNEFGEDWLIRFAGHVSQNPNVVTQVKSFFP